MATSTHPREDAHRSGAGLDPPPAIPDADHVLLVTHSRIAGLDQRADLQPALLNVSFAPFSEVRFRDSESDPELSAHDPYSNMAVSADCVVVIDVDDPLLQAFVFADNEYLLRARSGLPVDYERALWVHLADVMIFGLATFLAVRRARAAAELRHAPQSVDWTWVLQRTEMLDMAREALILVLLHPARIEQYGALQRLLDRVDTLRAAHVR